MSETEQVQVQVNPWDRLPGESNLWWIRFEKFRLMGPARTIKGLYDVEREHAGKCFRKQAPGIWKNHAVQYRWRERAGAWDQLALDELREEWAKRREKWRQDEWDLANMMHKKVLDMMVFPVARVIREADGKTTIIEPADWKLGDIPKMVDVISKIARLSTGLATERSETIDWNPNDCTEDELLQIAETGDVRGVLSRRKQSTSGARIASETPPALLAAGTPM